MSLSPPHQQKLSLRSRINRRFFYSARSSLVSTVVAFELFVALPVLLVLFVRMAVDGDSLTCASGATSTATAIVVFGVAGFLLWATFLEPYRRAVHRKVGLRENRDVSA